VGSPSCLNYGTDEVSLCFTSTNCCDYQASVNAYDGNGDQWNFTANFYAYTTSINGTADFCETSNETYTCVTDVPGVGANDYTWYPIPSFLSGSSTTDVLSTTTTNSGSGDITVTVSGAPGCPSGSASNTATLPLNSYSTTTLNAPGGTLEYELESGTCYYNANVPAVTGAEYYQWGKNSSFSSLWCSNTPGPTSTCAPFYSQTSYTLYVRAINACGNGNYSTYTKETPKAPGNCPQVILAGIIQNEESSAYKVYPNPANSELTIEYPVADNSELNLSIYDMLGQKVISRKLPSADGIDVENITSLLGGIYVFTIISGSEIVSRGKIIIQR
jgi:hypothetical protein